MPDKPNSLLLVTHVVLRQGPRGLQIDAQTAAGIAQWCQHFDEVTYFGVAEHEANQDSSSIVWVDLAERKGAERCQLVALPHAYRLKPMVREYRGVRAKLAKAVKTHQYLCFTIGGLVGDWPAIAGLEAIRQKRHYSAWIDRVEPVVIQNRLRGSSPLKRIAATLAMPLMEQYTKYLLRRSAAALLQGRDTFDHYAASASEPYCTYDTHTNASDRISPDDLGQKSKEIQAGTPLRILYVGRAAAMKGPFDWLDTLDILRRNLVQFSATWIGDGPDLQRMRERVIALDLSEHVTLPGFEGDREILLETMRESDLLLFCHKTPESPRCLIEALVSGCALIGYGTAYPRGLVEAHGGGVFTPQDDPISLAARIEHLNQDRRALSELVTAAARSGELYNEDAVYRHRAEIMRVR